MAGTAKKTNPQLWDKVKRKVTAGSKGGKPGQWSARKAQMAVSAYKQAGGGYAGGRGADNHLAAWTREEWGTRSGRTSRASGERYLPKRARQQLTEEEYDRSTAAKRRDTRAGKQFSRQPKDVARKTAKARTRGPARKPADRKPPVRQTATAKSASTKSATARSTVRKTPARKSTARKAPARKASPRKTATRQPATKAALRKTPARKPTARKPTARKPAAPSRPVRRKQGG